MLYGFYEYGIVSLYNMNVPSSLLIHSDHVNQQTPLKGRTDGRKDGLFVFPTLFTVFKSFRLNFLHMTSMESM